MSQFDLKNATIYFRDGTNPTPLELELKVAEGAISFTEKKPRKYTRANGRLHTVVDGDEEPVDVRIDLTWEFLRAVAASGTPTPMDVLKQRGEASSWVSSDTTDPCAPYAVDIVIEYDPGCASEDLETIVISDFRYEQVDGNPKEATLSVTGKAHVTEITATRS
jgi:hypothetical protein